MQFICLGLISSFLSSETALAGAAHHSCSEALMSKCYFVTVVSLIAHSGFRFHLRHRFAIRFQEQRTSWST